MRKWTYVLSFCFGVVNDVKRLRHSFIYGGDGFSKYTFIKRL